jgi:hypothetical protein
VRHAVETLQNDFEAKRLKLEVELPEEPLFCSADETRIKAFSAKALSPGTIADHVPSEKRFRPAGRHDSMKRARSARDIAGTHLTPGVALKSRTGSWQTADVKAIFSAASLAEITLLDDLAGTSSVVQGRSMVHAP